MAFTFWCSGDTATSWLRSPCQVTLFISIVCALFVTEGRHTEIMMNVCGYWCTTLQVNEVRTILRVVHSVLKGISTRSAVCKKLNAELHVDSHSWYLSRARCGGDCCVSLLAEYTKMKEDCNKFSVRIAAYSLGIILPTTTKPSLSVKTRQHWSTLLALDIKLALLPWPLVTWY